MDSSATILIRQVQQEARWGVCQARSYVPAAREDNGAVTGGPNSGLSFQQQVCLPIFQVIKTLKPGSQQRALSIPKERYL